MESGIYQNVCTLHTIANVFIYYFKASLLFKQQKSVSGKKQGVYFDMVLATKNSVTSVGWCPLAVLFLFLDIKSLAR
jgi:hypothetical protein